MLEAASFGYEIQMRQSGDRGTSACIRTHLNQCRGEIGRLPLQFHRLLTPLNPGACCTPTIRRVPMPVFRLTPIQGTEKNGRWRLSTIKPKCAWVHAKDEEDARWQVRLATTAAFRQMSATTEEPSPWADGRMVTCERDDSVVVPSGTIRVRDGTLLPVYRSASVHDRLLDRETLAPLAFAKK